MYIIFLETDNSEYDPLFVGIEESKDKALQHALTSCFGHPFGFGSTYCNTIRLELWNVGENEKAAEYIFKKVNHDWFEMVKVE